VLKQKLMVVTISYRLNVFGFLTTMDGEAPGNFGLMDQSAALLWVSSNIHLFGGNNTQVTLGGQGSGAISTSLHLTSGHSTDTFQKAIVMSGSSLLDLLIPEPRRFARSIDDLAKEYGCLRNPTSQLMVCLRRVSAEVLLKAAQSWGPIVDGNLSNDTQPFIEEDPRILVQRGMIKKVPVLIGYTNFEEALVTLSGDMLKNGVSEEMYMTLVDETVKSQMIAFDSNDTEACNGNEQLISEAVNFVYKPPEMADTMLIRQKYIEFTTEREYVAPR
jgi:carboxylesterase type B